MCLRVPQQVGDNQESFRSIANKIEGLSHVLGKYSNEEDAPLAVQARIAGIVK